MDLNNEEYKYYVFLGILSIIYSCIDVYNTKKGECLFSDKKNIHLIIDLFVTVTGISTFFSISLPGCFAGIYIGMYQILGMLYYYREDKKNESYRNRSIYYRGICISFCTILSALHYIMIIC